MFPSQHIASGQLPGLGFFQKPKAFKVRSREFTFDTCLKYVLLQGNMTFGLTQVTVLQP